MEPERIEFPTSYPIKVVFRTEPALRELIHAVFERYFGPQHPDSVSERLSGQGQFIALTYVPHVQHQDQLRELHIELKAIEGVMLVL